MFPSHDQLIQIIFTFIALSDNVHEGEYDLEKLIEEMEEIEELNLKDILDPAILRKVDKKSLTDEPDMELKDIDKIDDSIEISVSTSDLIVANVPNAEYHIYSDFVERMKQITGMNSEWKILKTVLNVFTAKSNEEIKTELKGRI